MNMGSYIIKPLASFTLADLERQKTSTSSTEHDTCDSGCETASLTSFSPASIMSEDSSYENSETIKCDSARRSPSPVPHEPRNITIRLSCVNSEHSTTNPAESKSIEQAKLLSSENAEQSITATKQSKISLLASTKPKQPTSEWPKSRVLTVEQLNSERQPSPQQCSFCGKYEKRSKPHLRCELCGFSTYCRTKCQDRDRERHYKHDCLIRETTPWFSIKRNKYHFKEVCTAEA